MNRSGRLTVNQGNLGDQVQILAGLLFFKKIDVIINRDTELDKPIDEKVVLLMNAYFKQHYNNVVGWPPHENILPVFFGFHMVCTDPHLVSKNAIEYYNKWQPIGCRDTKTKSILDTKGVETRSEVFCPSMLFPKREVTEDQTEIFIVSADKDILKYLPEDIKSNATFVTHYVMEGNHNDEELVQKAQDLLDMYKNKAKLVITTLLHCSLPCLGMGIPLILFYPPRGGHVHEMDKNRFGAIGDLTRIYSVSEINEVNWSPEPAEFEDRKKRYADLIYNELAKHLSEDVITNPYA